MAKTDRITREIAENLAIHSLSFLASDPERLGQFLAATGIGPDMIREAATDPSFLAGVLDYVAADEQLLLAVAQHAGVAPEAIERAHTALSGQWEREVP